MYLQEGSLKYIFLNLRKVQIGLKNKKYSPKTTLPWIVPVNLRKEVWSWRLARLNDADCIVALKCYMPLWLKESIGLHCDKMQECLSVRALQKVILRNFRDLSCVKLHSAALGRPREQEADRHRSQGKDINWHHK